MLSNHFSSHKIIKETDHFALTYVPTDDPFSDKIPNYYIVYKPFSKVEVTVDSFPVALSYLKQAEEAMVNEESVKDSSAPTVLAKAFNH